MINTRKQTLTCIRLYELYVNMPSYSSQFGHVFTCGHLNTMFLSIITYTSPAKVVFAWYIKTEPKD